MHGRIQSTGVLWLALAILTSFPLLSSRSRQAPPIIPGQSVFIVAARDSHLLTMCPTMEPVKLPNGRVWKSDGTALVSYPFANEEFVRFFEDGRPTPITLPLPVGGPGKSMAEARPVPDRPELDRVAPDPEIKRRIEKEFLKRREFVLADSATKADLVFLAEGTYTPMQIGKMASASGIAFWPRGDNRAEFLQSVFAIVVPAAIYNPVAVQSTTLMSSRLWEGSAIWQNTRFVGGVEIAPASPEAVVAQFHNKAKRPPNHFPLCAASAQPLRTAATATKSRSEVPAFKDDPKGTRVPPALDPRSTAKSHTIRVDVTLVTVPVTVGDQNGKRISDLTYSDFHLFEDDVEQKIDGIIPEAEPFDVALMLDTSASMRIKADETQTSALAFAGAVRPAERIMIVSFDDRIRVQSEPSAEMLQLRAALSLMRPGEGTRLYDAIDLVLKDRLNGIKGRKAVVLFTDGVDTRSRIASAADTLAAIEESNVLVYALQYDTSRENVKRPVSGIESWVVLPQDLQNNSDKYKRADKYLYSLCNGSGGELYLAPEGSNLTEVFARIADQLSHQITLSYYPTNGKQDGSFHRLRVEVNRPGARVRSRIGYRDSGRSPNGR